MRTSTWILAVGCGLVAGAFAERFDLKVRDDFFAGFSGNAEALDRGMKACEDALKTDPNNAEALVWHGGGLFYQSGRAFRNGDRQHGMELFLKSTGEMDRAVALEPDNPGVRIPRGAILITGSRFIDSPEIWRPLVEKGVSDYERTLELQSEYFDQLGTHPRGELLFGLAAGYSRLGNQAKARTYFARIEKDLPGTPYAKRAAAWMEAKSLTLDQTGCVGCHTGN